MSGVNPKAQHMAGPGRHQPERLDYDPKLYHEHWRLSPDDVGRARRAAAACLEHWQTMAGRGRTHQSINAHQSPAEILAHGGVTQGPERHLRGARPPEGVPGWLHEVRLGQLALTYFRRMLPEDSHRNPENIRWPNRRGRKRA